MRNKIRRKEDGGKRIYKPDRRNKEREREEVEINVNDLRSLTGVTTTAVPWQNIYYSVVYAGMSKISTSQSSQHMSRITANNHQSLKLTKCHLQFAGHFVPCKGIYQRQSWILDSVPWFQIPVLWGYWLKGLQRRDRAQQVLSWCLEKIAVKNLSTWIAVKICTMFQFCKSHSCRRKPTYTYL